MTNENSFPIHILEELRDDLAMAEIAGELTSEAKDLLTRIKKVIEECKKGTADHLLVRRTLSEAFNMAMNELARHKDWMRESARPKHKHLRRRSSN